MTHQVLQTISHDMFHLPLPLAEKVLRPVVVYLCLIVFLRLFGKRELAQLNPFDLVVLLSLSNTVQNAIIGDDNSVTGGIVGAFALLAINWLLMWVLYRSPKLTKTLEGDPATLVRDGVADVAELKRQSLTQEELVSVLNKNGYNDVERGELMAMLSELTAEVRALRLQVEAKGSSMGAG